MRVVRWLGIVFLLIVAFSLVRSWIAPSGPEIEPGSILVVQMNGKFTEAPSAPAIAKLFGGGATPFVGLLSQLAKAERDERIETVVLRISRLGVGWGKAQELRAAIARLRAAGRYTIAYLELETLSAHIEYFVAAAADEVQIVPGGAVPLVGLAAEYFYLGGVFDKLGVDFEVAKAGRYKSAVEMIAHTGMSPASREMANSLLDSISGQFSRAIAEDRGLTLDEVRERIDRGPVLARELVSLGFADGISHLDELLAERGGEVVEGADYAAVDPASIGFEPEATYALVYGSGTVVSGDATFDSQGNSVFSAGGFSDALEQAVEAEEVDAIILRIDSPGGSALASEIVWRAIRKARAESGKPMIASFSDVAASGGYYVASAADEIVAPAASVTGSIGVFALRPVLGRLFEDVGLEVELLQRGRYADLASSSRALSDGALERLERIVLETYDQFLERVAAGRSLEIAQVDAIAQGRVWTGEQAYERGLVDHLGGLREAVVRAKLAQGLDADADVLLVTYPPPKPLMQQIVELLDARIASAVRAQLPLPDPVLRLQRIAGVLPAGTPLLIPPVLVEIR